MKLSNKRNQSRLKAVVLLEKQLKRGTKPARDENGKTTNEMVPLSENDLKRINRELETLKKRTVTA